MTYIKFIRPSQAFLLCLHKFYIVGSETVGVEAPVACVLLRIFFLTSMNVCAYVHTVCVRESVFLTDDYI